MDWKPDSPPHVPEGLQAPFRDCLAAAAAAWSGAFGPRLISVFLFGSVARRQAQSSSDIDVLVIVQEPPRSLWERCRPFLEEWERVRAEHGLPRVEWNLVVKSVEEGKHRSPLYLDIAEDGIPIIDRNGFFGQVLEKMRSRMRELGSRRVFIEDGSWYWDLKPDFRFGEVVEI